MYFPIADVTISPILLMGVGFLVGILGGFFGVGGGFLAGPMMFWAGVPMNFVIGTDLAHMTGKSIVATHRHRTLGHVDMKLGMYMVMGTIVGVEIGARFIEALQDTGAIDITIGVTYIVILVCISIFTGWESIRAIQMVRTDQIDVQDAVGFKGLSKRIRAVNIPPMVSFPVSGIESISIWMVLGVGFFTGIAGWQPGCWWGFYQDADAYLCFRHSNPCRCRNRLVRNYILFRFWHNYPCLKRKRGYINGVGYAYRGSNRGPDRRNGNPILRWSPHSFGFFFPPYDRSSFSRYPSIGHWNDELRRITRSYEDINLSGE